MPDTTLKASGFTILTIKPFASISFAKHGDYQGGRRWCSRMWCGRRSMTGKRMSAPLQRKLAVGSGSQPAQHLLVQPEQMSAWNLHSYASIFGKRQKALRYEIALWTKDHVPARRSGDDGAGVAVCRLSETPGRVGAKIFAGIMLGLAFYFLNRLFAHLGLLNDWPPVLSAVLPTLIFLAWRW